MNNRQLFDELLWRSAQLNAPTHYVNDLLVHDRAIVDGIDDGATGPWFWVARECGTHLTQSRDHVRDVVKVFCDVRGVYQIWRTFGEWYVQAIPVGHFWQ